MVAEDLTRRFAVRKTLGKNVNRRLAGWTKGATAEALASVSERRGSVLVHVNAAYTSQTCHRCAGLGRRSGDRFHCTRCRVVWQADVNAAINILQRAGDPDIALHTPHQTVKQILQDRTDRHRTRLPVQDSSPATAERRAKHPNRS
ncbi:MAG: zinc ribbon domain-containing protein [Micromonospora sp.]